VAPPCWRAAPGVVTPPRINVAGRYGAISDANGSAVGTTAKGAALTQQDSQRAGDFIFNTNLLNWEDAEQSCRDQGGHLADYQSFTEQYANEKWYIDEGYLFAKYHKVYWMGLSTTEDMWPTFTWANPMINGPSATDYNNWGTMRWDAA
jgi:hypothetical protein